MGAIAESSFIIIIVLLFVISLIIAIYMGNYKNYSKSVVHTFISIITGLGIIVIFTFYFINVSSINQSDDIEIKKEISEINELVYITIPHKMNDIYRNCECLVDELNECDEGNKKDDNNYHEEVALCYLIFSSWKRFLLFSQYINKNSDYDSYVNVFSKWGKSKKLKSHWINNRKYFDKKTISFGDAIFDQKTIDQIISLI